jgi:hypothetical protein
MALDPAKNTPDNKEKQTCKREVLGSALSGKTPQDGQECGRMVRGGTGRSHSCTPPALRVRSVQRLCSDGSLHTLEQLSLKRWLPRSGVA